MWLPKIATSQILAAVRMMSTSKSSGSGSLSAWAWSKTGMNAKAETDTAAELCRSIVSHPGPLAGHEVSPVVIRVVLVLELDFP